MESQIDVFFSLVMLLYTDKQKNHQQFKIRLQIASND